MGKLTRTCLCGSETHSWRSCPIKECNEESVFCQVCGGDDKATIQMRQHIYTYHTDTIVTRKALVAFRARLLMKHYRESPHGQDVGYMTGYFFLREDTIPSSPVVLEGEIIQGVRIPQPFRWFKVAPKAMWEGYFALLADEPVGDVEFVEPEEIKMEV